MIDEHHLGPQQAEEVINSQPYRGAHIHFEVIALIDDIFNESWRTYKMNRLVKTQLPLMVNDSMLEKINEVNDLLFFNQFQFVVQEQQEAEPTPLFVDSLLPISADIDPQNAYRNKVNQKTQLGQSQVKPRLGKGQSVVDKPKPYIKLDIPDQEEEDGFTKELRKTVMESQFKADNQKKSRQRKERAKAEQANTKQKRRDEKVSYDYQGNMISLKTENKANLISKFVGSKTPGQGRIAKEAIMNPNPTKINGQRPGSLLKEGKSNPIIIPASPAPSKKKEDVQFSQVKSLAENVKANPGVRYTYQGKSIEEKRKQRTMVEIKKSLSQNKLSKDQYHKLKALSTNRQDLQDRLKKSVVNDSAEGTIQTLGSMRSKSQARISGYRSGDKSKATIHISSETLKQKLLEPQRPQMLKLAEGEEHQSEVVSAKGDNMMGTIDNFNVEYMRTGGKGGQANTTRQFYSHRQSSHQQLPRIQHTTIYSKMPPKGRERLKQGNDILREMRKKFEEKLRV